MGSGTSLTEFLWTVLLRNTSHKPSNLETLTGVSKLRVIYIFYL